MSGSDMVLQGVTFQNGGSSSSDLRQTRGSGDLPCNYCRITEKFNNYSEGCSFAGSNFNGGIVLTDSDASGYQQVDNVFIAHNTIVNGVNSINFAGGKTDASRHSTKVTMCLQVTLCLFYLKFFSLKSKF